MDFYASEGIPLGEIRKVSAHRSGKLGGEIVIVPPGALHDLWSRKFPDPVTAFASGWMRIRARARQGGVTLPLVVSDHADWDGLCTTIRDTGCGEVWVTHGEEDALVHWARTQGSRAQPLHMIGYGDEGEEEGEPSGTRGCRMNRFAELLDRLAYEPARNAKLRLLADYFRSARRSRPRLRARRHDRRARLRQCQARPHPRADRRAHRSGALRHVLRLRRRPFRDGRADVAGAAAKARAPPPPSLSEVVETLLHRRQARSAAPSRAIGSTGSTRPDAGPC